MSSSSNTLIIFVFSFSKSSSIEAYSSMKNCMSLISVLFSDDVGGLLELFVLVAFVVDISPTGNPLFCEIFESTWTSSEIGRSFGSRPITPNAFARLVATLSVLGRSKPYVPLLLLQIHLLRFVVDGRRRSVLATVEIISFSFLTLVIVNRPFNGT